MVCLANSLGRVGEAKKPGRAEGIPHGGNSECKDKEVGNTMVCLGGGNSVGFCSASGQQPARRLQSEWQTCLEETTVLCQRKRWHFALEKYGGVNLVDQDQYF